MKRISQYVVAVTVPVMLLLGILWTDGFTFGLDEDGINVVWSDLGDHCTNWADTVLHPWEN